MLREERVVKALDSARNLIGLMMCGMTAEQRERVSDAYREFTEEIKDMPTRRRP